MGLDIDQCKSVDRWKRMLSYIYILGQCYNIHIGNLRLYYQYNSQRLSQVSVAQLVVFLVVEPIHLGSCPRFGMGVCIFLDLF